MSDMRKSDKDPGLVTIALQLKLAEGLDNYLKAKDADPIWVDKTDVVNDLVTLFLIEKGFYLCR